LARIRTYKPDFFKSEDVSVLPFRARLTWLGLWPHCDDHGRFKDSVKLIKAEVWPLDNVSLRDIEEDLAVLAEYGRIVRYEVGGKQYLAVVNWHAHQSINRPSRPKCPAPPVPLGSTDPEDPNHCAVCARPNPGATTAPVETHEPSVNPHGALTEDSPLEGKGKEGKGREGNARAGEDTKPPPPTALAFRPPETPDKIQPSAEPRQLDLEAASTAAGHHGLQEGPAGKAPTGHLAPGEPPLDRCPRHVDDVDPPNCRPCGRARATREQWDRDQADAQRRADLERRSAEARQRAETSRMAIAACRICDERGYLASGRQCTHDPARIGSNGAAAARAAIRRPATQEPR
jgi:hypothetical protein